MRKTVLFISMLLVAGYCFGQMLEQSDTNYFETLTIDFSKNYWDNTNNHVVITEMLTEYWPNWLELWPTTNLNERPWIMGDPKAISNALGAVTHYEWKVLKGKFGRTNNTDQAFNEIINGVPVKDRSSIGLRIGNRDVRVRTTTTSTTTTSTTTTDSTTTAGG